MKKLLLATTVIVTMSGTAFAQTASSMDRTQLESVAEQAFSEAQIDYDVDLLTDDQLTQIRDSVEEREGEDLRRELYVIVGTENEPNYDPAVDNAVEGTGEPSQLQATAAQMLRDAGIAYPVAMLDSAQLASIKTLEETGSGPDVKNDLWAIIGFENQPDMPDPIGDSVEMTQVERSQLEMTAYDMLTEHGVPYDVDKISNSQLAEIKALTDEDDADQARELKSILGVDS
ncbi:uS13 family ribosomal protein [Mangrovicoccus algicola]|uniref:Uncharacterized protein n=1 Tax=Mangrovicoccus algicola TaxID=2771008 RepID=A0A8J7CHT9_9RHOB|nr:hypothetical protein [Mangrovicoccus algicola]MBE3638670.1 hypothetical protein [Mangrovicoccus algicola]